MRHAAAALIVISTASSCGSASTAGPEDAGAMDSAPISSIEMFHFIDGLHSEMPYSQDDNYSATRAGEITYHFGYAPLLTAMFSDTDRSRFVLFLDAPTTIAAVTSTDRCPMGPADSHRVITLSLRNGAKLSRYITGCDGPTFDAILEWAGAIRGYFP